MQGHPSVSRAVINEGTGDAGQKTYHLLVEGYGLHDVMGCQGVEGREVVSNHIMNMQVRALMSNSHMALCESKSSPNLRPAHQPSSSH